VALVIRGAAFGLAGAHRQQRLAAIERLLGRRRYGVLGALTGIAGTVGATAGPVVAGRIFDMTNSYVGAFELFILLDIIGAVAAFACKPYSSQKGQALRSHQYRPPRSSELR
jgi:MFS family permease